MNTPTCAGSSTRSKPRPSSSSFATCQLAKSKDEKSSALTLTLNLTTFYRAADGPDRDAAMSESGKPTSKRQIQLLVGLGAVLAALLVFQVLPMMMGGAQPTGRRRPRRQRPRRPQAAAPRRARRVTVEDVRLAKLEQEWPAPGETRRNPFTMAPTPPPPSAARERGGETGATSGPRTAAGADGTAATAADSAHHAEVHWRDQFGLDRQDCRSERRQVRISRPRGTDDRRPLSHREDRRRVDSDRIRQRHGPSDDSADRASKRATKRAAAQRAASGACCCFECIPAC